MGKRGERYQLTTRVELDEGFFSIELPDRKKQAIKKGIRQSKESQRTRNDRKFSIRTSPKERKALQNG